LALVGFIAAIQIPAPAGIGGRGRVRGTQDKQRGQSKVTVQRASSAATALSFSAGSLMREQVQSDNAGRVPTQDRHKREPTGKSLEGSFW